MVDKVIRDITKQSLEAEEAASKIDFIRQYSVPDVNALERKLRAAYIHGYQDALLKEKYSI